VHRRASAIRENVIAAAVGCRICSENVWVGDTAGCPLALTAEFCAKQLT
jgi:hypothetical protein